MNKTEKKPGLKTMQVEGGNPKGKCMKCGKIYRASKLKYVPLFKEWRCYFCRKKYGANKFYTPKIPGRKKSEIIGNYSLTKRERYMLFKKFKNQGVPDSLAWKKVDERSYTLGWQRNLKKFKRPKKTQNTKFLEGLNSQVKDGGGKRS
jgi:hypothetical protein